MCSLAELQKLGRKRVTVNERVVVLFHVKGEVYALDHFCYRESTIGFCTLCCSLAFSFPSDTGGPLELGDIEVNSSSFCCINVMFSAGILAGTVRIMQPISELATGSGKTIHIIA